MKQIVFKKIYCGFEDIYDLGRDIDEMWESENFKDIPGEFKGNIIVTVEYEDADANVPKT